MFLWQEGFSGNYYIIYVKRKGSEKMKSKFRIAALLFVFMPIVCQAAIIKIGFSGVVDSVSDPYNLLENGVQVSTLISGYYIYDSETPNSDSQPLYNGLYQYSNAPYGMSVVIGDLTFETNNSDADFEIAISNNFYGASHDYYGITSDNNYSVGDLTIDSLHWQLDDYSGTALTNTDLPLDALDLLKWQTNRLSIMGGRYPFPSESEKTLFGINGHITDVWLIPEPATFLLLGLGGWFLRTRK